MKHNKILILSAIIILLLSLSIFLSACSEQKQESINETISCSTDQDCIPMPGCHPTKCINSEFENNYEQAEMCTMVYMFNAAYNDEDCLCQENKCVNKNLETETIELIEEKKEINDWHYQLQGASFTSLLKLNVDLIVIDHFENPLSELDIKTLNEQDKIVLSYLSIGEAENYRSYWEENWTVNNPEYIDEENPEWEGNFKVEYWNEEWQKIIIERVKLIAQENYDGVYLDIIDAYEYYEEKGNNMARYEMINFVKYISQEAKKINPDFLIIAQNGIELYDNPEYKKIIDGLGVEDTWYYEETKISKEETNYRLKYLDEALEDGKIVLAVDYPLTPSKICIFYSNCKLHHFGCTVTNKHLDKDQSIPCRN